MVEQRPRDFAQRRKVANSLKALEQDKKAGPFDRRFLTPPGPGQLFFRRRVVIDKILRPGISREPLIGGLFKCRHCSIYRAGSAPDTPGRPVPDQDFDVAIPFAGDANHAVHQSAHQ